MKKLGLMVDCSRNAVLSIPAAKRLVDLLETLGYTYLELYTEDTYEVKGEPHFGCFRGRYTIEELKELDAYCIAHGITLKPCIQTLGHLESIFRWDEYQKVRDCVNILLCEEEATYTLIDHMFSSLAEAFTCREINIGMDEAFLVGHGKYFRKHGFVPPVEIMRRHLTRVVEIAEKYGFRCEMWGDLFATMAYSDLSGEVSLATAQAAIPDSVSLICWDYYNLNQTTYETKIQKYQALTERVAFAGGIWTWRGFAPGTSFALRATEAAMRACQACGVQDFMTTAWGDDGGECDLFSALPAIVATAEFAKGNYDMQKIARVFRRVVGMDWDLFLALEHPITLNADPNNCPVNPANNLLYNDPFLGMCDCAVAEGQGDYYASLAKTLKKGTRNATWGYLFRMEQVLCEVLAIKCDLGIKTRRLYQTGDKEALLALAKTAYPASVRLLRRFHRVFRETWMTTKKPYGFEVQDIRLGGLILRLETCANTLLDYCEGRISHIPELEETPHYAYEGTPAPCAMLSSYQGSVTPAKMIHEFYN